MSTNYIQVLKKPASLQYPLMISVALHLCIFSTIFIWNPWAQSYPQKNPSIKIKVALLETPQKTPAPSMAQKQIQTTPPKSQANNKPMGSNPPTVSQLAPVQAKPMAPRQTRNSALQPSLNIQSFSGFSAGSISKLFFCVRESFTLNGKRKTSRSI